MWRARETGILLRRVGANLDLRKNWHLVEWSVFCDAEALRRFRAHPAHGAATAEIARFADWVAGDIDLGDTLSFRAAEDGLIYETATQAPPFAILLGLARGDVFAKRAGLDADRKPRLLKSIALPKAS